MESNDPYYWCAVCTNPITGDEIDARHSDDDGRDVHEACCPICLDIARYEEGN